MNVSLFSSQSFIDSVGKKCQNQQIPQVFWMEQFVRYQIGKWQSANFPPEIDETWLSGWLYCLFDLWWSRELIKDGKDIENAYWELVVKDIQDTCKLLEPIYTEKDGVDGYVSVPVSPRLADDTIGTIEAAKWLHKMVGCPNVYIKIPATEESIPSIKEVISQGISVNVTVSTSCHSVIEIFLSL